MGRTRICDAACARQLANCDQSGRQTTAATHSRLCKSNCQGGQAAFFLANLALIEATSARGVAANSVLV